MVSSYIICGKFSYVVWEMESSTLCSVGDGSLCGVVISSHIVCDVRDGRFSYVVWGMTNSHR